MKTTQQEIRIECTGADVLELDQIKELQGNLKKRGKKEIDQIITSIEKYGFSFPFFVWRGEGQNLCMDGHGRLEALAEMRRRGAALPSFPVAYVEAKDRDEAKQKLLRLNSQFGVMTFDSVMEFTEGLEVDWGDLALPDGLSLDMEASEDGEDETYTRKILAPTYEPRNEKPSLDVLTDDAKAMRLVADISLADIPELEKKFLTQAAMRHVVFDYGKIADYYAHSGPVVQDLMERSALVIIDFDKAIENGYVQLSKELADQYDKDVANEE